MRERIVTLVLGTLLALMLAAPASAQATRTWVSGVGDDVNPCSRTAPCKTFAGAISKTAANGIINCLDPAGYGAVTITKNMTIDCVYTKGGVLASGTNGINVNAAGIIVVLRGLSIEGNGTTTGLVGVNILAAAAVHIEQCDIRSFRSGNATGIRIATTSGNPEIYVTDTQITDNGTGATGGGIVSASTGGFPFVTVHNVRLFNNVHGVANNVNSRMRIDESVISGNLIGIQVDSGGLVSFANTDLYFNGTAISGATSSFGNNRIIGNTADGTAPTPAGAVSNTFGQK